MGEVIIRRQAQYSVEFSYYYSAHQNLNARLITIKAIPIYCVSENVYANHSQGRG